MQYHENILTTIGDTPMVKLNKIVKGLPALVLGKIETFNPGHSTKDRMALKMIEDAEKAGLLKPGGTIIEGTSGNTGMGLAMAAVIKGYNCIFTTTDKQSKEKMDMLRALGAEVIVCPTAVEAEDPRSYYSVSKRLGEEVPNSYYVNQYDNLSNREAHYESTGPEIWEQTAGKITHFIVGVGTGGTISGVGKYLKEKNPNIKIWGIDTYGSVLKKYHETGEFDEKEIYPYVTEGIGEDILPENVDFSLIDHFEKVTDKDGAVMTRRLAREEGLLLGYSAGSAVAGLLQMKEQLTEDDVVVILFHDHGSRYIGKIFNDNWMRERGYLDSEMTAGELVRRKQGKEFLFVKEGDSLGDILNLMRDKDYSQMPVMDAHYKVIGSVSEAKILSKILENPTINGEIQVQEVMEEPLPIIQEDMTISKLSRYMSDKQKAIIVQDKAMSYHMLTSFDLIRCL